HSVSLGQIVEFKLPIAHTKMIERQNLREKCLANLVSPLDENIREVPLRCGIADLASFHGRADFVIGERHYLFGRPKRISGQTVQEGGIRMLRRPSLGIEHVAFDAAYGGIFLVFGERPSGHKQPERKELNGGLPPSEEIFAAGPRAVGPRAGTA